MHSGHDTSVPSLRRRAIQSIALLFGFYVMTIVLVAILLAAPMLVFLVEKPSAMSYLVAFACGWVPAFLLLKGVLRVRRPRFAPSDEPLARRQAPELFAILDDLATRARTAPPAEIYLSPFPELGVSEVGGRFGIGGRRILVLGAPLLSALTVQELRAGLAHELGHYLGGDTKLSGVVGYTEALFRSVLTSIQSTSQDHGHFAMQAGRSVADGIGRIIIGGYARLYLRLTRPDGRRQELAADALSARLAGRAAVIRALETVHVFGPLYEAYLELDVARATSYDAVPSDITSGFELFRSRVRAEGNEAAVAQHAREAKTDPYDTHPALTDRVNALLALPDAPSEDDARPAVELIADGAALEAWLTRATGKRLSNEPSDELRYVPWAQIPSGVVGPSMRQAAEKLAASLGPLHPEAITLTSMFAAVSRSLASGGLSRLVFHLAPSLMKCQPEEQVFFGKVYAQGVLETLFQGALLESGAEVEMPVADSRIILRLAHEPIDVPALVAAAMAGPEGAAHLLIWADRLYGAAVASTGLSVFPNAPGVGAPSAI